MIMESIYIDTEEINERIKEAEKLVKKYPYNVGLKLNLESLKSFRGEAITELKRRGNGGTRREN